MSAVERQEGGRRGRSGGGRFTPSYPTQKRRSISAAFEGSRRMNFVPKHCLNKVIQNKNGHSYSVTIVNNTTSNIAQQVHHFILKDQWK